MTQLIRHMPLFLLLLWVTASGCQNCGSSGRGLFTQGSLMQPRSQVAAIAPPNSYSYGQPDRYYPQSGLSDRGPPPTLGRAAPPPGRFYDPRNALVANELEAVGTGANNNLSPNPSTWERNGDFASISRSASSNRPNNSRLEAIAGMPVNDGTRSYSPLDMNNSSRTARSDVADRYGARRSYGATAYAARSGGQGGYPGDSVGTETTYNGSSSLRGMRGMDSRQFDLGERDEDAERR